MQLRAIDLFAGCGGLSLGLMASGIDVVAANEIDTWACDTYERNHKETTLIRGDIRYLAPHIWSDMRGGIDILAGGPPCQGFSVSGRRQYGEVPQHNTLVEEFLKVVKLVRPRCVLMENVAGFKTAQLRPGVLALPFTLDRLCELGYEPSWHILQATDYGVPSVRRRIFIVAHRKESRSVDIGQRFMSALSPAVARQTSCLEAISDLPSLGSGEGSDGMTPYARRPANAYQRRMRTASDGVFNHVAMNHTPRVAERFASIKPGHSSYSTSSGSITVYKSNNQRLVSGAPSLCITANFQSNYIHPVQNRNLTAREAARLMSYPDSFIFTGKRTLMSKSLLLKLGREAEANLSQYNQIGNSVPPSMAASIGRALISILSEKKKGSERRAKNVRSETTGAREEHCA